MKSLVIILLILSLSSCSYIGATEDVLIGSTPTASTTSLSSTTTQTPVETTLILNTNSKKIHYYEACSYAKNIKAENKGTATYEDIETLMSDGYSVCSWCEKQHEKS